MENSRLARGIRRWAPIALLALTLCGGLAAAAAPVRTPQVEAELVAEHSAVAPGRTATVALRLAIAEHWHTYWRNPGDSGLPTRLQWTLPEGVAAGPIQWPYPKALPVGPLVNYGYEGEVFHLVELAVPASASPGTTLSLAAKADWLVCRETCIPESAELTLALPVAAEPGPPTRWRDAMVATRAALPRAMPADWRVRAEGAGPSIRLEIVPPRGLETVAGTRFFPLDEGRIEASGAQTASAHDGGVALTLPVASQLAPGFSRLTGVAVHPQGWPGAGRAMLVDVPLAGSVVAGAAPAMAAVPLDLATPGAAGIGSAATTIWIALASALLGGVLLNLMPCVFPVLSLKLLSFAQRDRNSPAGSIGKGVAFGAGVLVTFWLLAGLLLAFKAAGQQLGWGFQLQSPPVIAALAVLFFVLALNLSGVFEFGVFAPGAMAAWRGRRPLLDAFGGGVLAVLVASPCTAPFMGAALGFALSQSALVTLAVFSALAVGMALPFALLAAFPGWQRRLPRPGPWMLRLKQLLAFPLYATVIWLAWVLGVQLGVDAILRLLATLLAVALGLWLLFGQGPRRSGAAMAFGVAAIAVATVLAWPVLAGGWAGSTSAGAGVVTGSETSGGATRGATGAQGPRKAAASPWERWSPQRLGELDAAGKVVFVDFTAAWCVTCQVNKQLVLERDSVLAAFRERGVTLLRADWTRHDPEITRALQLLGRNGVPVYVLYRPGKAPMLLPEILQESSIRAALASI